MEKTSDGFPRISRKDDDDHEDEGEIPLNGYKSWAILSCPFGADFSGRFPGAKHILAGQLHMRRYAAAERTNGLVTFLAFLKPVPICRQRAPAHSDYRPPPVRVPLEQSSNL
jgi:hypothetical protein